MPKKKRFKVKKSSVPQQKKKNKFDKLAKDLESATTYLNKYHGPDRVYCLKCLKVLRIHLNLCAKEIWLDYVPHKNWNLDYIIRDFVKAVDRFLCEIEEMEEIDISTRVRIKYDNHFRHRINQLNPICKVN
tara:strand:+ start:128 stop:520 length:393 start_codon:yes stop_codon:yes gene_type:complete